MPMKCLYCDEDYYKHSSLQHILFSKDPLCEECRKKLLVQHRYLQLGDYQVECFYEYNDFFRSLILQYKECFDEALKDIFLLKIKRYLEIRYHGYSVAWVPSSRDKLELRGFDHMEKMLECLNLKKENCLYQVENLDQKHKTYIERKKMIDNIRANKVNNTKLLIIDDVITTGASMLAAIKAVEPMVTVVKTVSLSCSKEWIIKP